MRHLAAVVVALTAALVACESGTDVVGAVEISAEVRGLFSPSESGDLLVEFSDSNDNMRRVRLVRLCGGEATSFDVKMFTLGCAATSVDVLAWVAPHDPSLGSSNGPAELPCDEPLSPRDRFVFYRSDAGEGSLAQASISVDVSRHGTGGCKSGEAQFDLLLELP